MEHVKKTTRKRTKEGEKNTASVSLANNAAIGALCALVLCFVFLFVASWLLVRGTLPEDAMGGTTIAILFVSSFLGASYAMLRHKGKNLIVGLLQGGILYALTFVIGAFADRASLLGELSPMLFAAALLGGALASFMPKKRKKRK